MIHFVAKSMFFDRQAVLSAEHKAKMRYLNRAGAAVRLTAQRLQRKRKRSSKPGESPSAHENPLLRKRTLYGYDSRTDSAVVGPERLNGSKAASGTVPEALEFGGETLVDEVQLTGGLWKRRSLVPLSTPVINRRRRRAKIAARPYMGPALARNLPRLPSFWAKSIKA